MRTLLALFVIIVLGVTVTATTTNNSIINSTQIQSQIQKIPAPPSTYFRRF